MRENGKGSGGEKKSKREKEGEEGGGGVREKLKVGEVKRKKERCGDVNRIEHGW